MSIDTVPAGGPTSTSADELTDAQWELAERIDLVLEKADPAGLTRSGIAKKVHCDYFEVAHVLDYLVEHRHAHTTGNGAWARYHKGRAR